MRAFGRGYLPSVVGIFPYAGFDLFFAETAKLKIQKTHKWLLNQGIIIHYIVMTSSL